jgi:radical SAM protein with 4Fe4S-binding SPASM domain
MVIDTDGTLLPCCEYKYPAPTYKSENNFTNFDTWWTVENERLRQDMLTDTHNAGCTYCKHKESIPGQSHLRQHHNKFHPIRNDNYTPEIERIEIRFGNYCNLKCLMCGPYASSSLGEEYLRNEEMFAGNSFKLYNVKTIRWWEEPGALDKLYSIVRNVKDIHMTGGEPMMIPEVVDILNSIEDTNVKVTFNTNMTRFTDKVFTALSRFKTVEIYASLEGANEHNDYIRYGSKWETVVQAVEQIKTYPNIKLSINTVLQHSSIYTLPGLINYARDNNIKLQFTEVYPGSGYGSGGYLTVNSAVPEDVEKFNLYLKENPNPTLESWINSYKFDPEQHVKFRKFVGITDKIRGVSFQKMFNPGWI